MSIPAIRNTPRDGSNAAPLKLETNAYLTDGINLFRCISIERAPQPDALAVLEDCRSLEVVIVPLADLDAEQLRIVQPAENPPRPIAPAAGRGDGQDAPAADR